MLTPSVARVLFYVGIMVVSVAFFAVLYRDDSGGGGGAHTPVPPGPLVFLSDWVTVSHEK